MNATGKGYEGRLFYGQHVKAGLTSFPKKTIVLIIFPG